MTTNCRLKTALMAKTFGLHAICFYILFYNIVWDHFCWKAPVSCTAITLKPLSTVHMHISTAAGKNLKSYKTHWFMSVFFYCSDKCLFLTQRYGPALPTTEQHYTSLGCMVIKLGIEVNHQILKKRLSLCSLSSIKQPSVGRSVGLPVNGVFSMWFLVQANRSTCAPAGTTVPSTSWGGRTARPAGSRSASKQAWRWEVRRLCLTLLQTSPPRNTRLPFHSHIFNLLTNSFFDWSQLHLCVALEKSITASWINVKKM